MADHYTCDLAAALDNQLLATNGTQVPKNRDLDGSDDFKLGTLFANSRPSLGGIVPGQRFLNSGKSRPRLSTMLQCQ